MTTQTTFFASIALVRDLLILLVVAIGAGPVVDYFAWIIGQQPASLYFGFLQPQFALFYVFIILLGISRFGWFFLTAVQRTDYEEMF